MPHNMAEMHNMPSGVDFSCRCQALACTKLVAQETSALRFIGYFEVMDTYDYKLGVLLIWQGSCTGKLCVKACHQRMQLQRTPAAIKLQGQMCALLLPVQGSKTCQAGRYSGRHV